MYKVKTSIILLAMGILLFSCKKEVKTEIVEESNTVEIDSISFELPPGFVLESLYQPSKNDQGSWVALAQGPNETIYACDQYGKIYRFNAPKEGSTLSPENIKPLDLEIGEAHGLLWAHNSLYVAVNKNWDNDVPDEQENASGVYRITDTDGDGELDKIEMLLKLEGSGEHGPHSFVESPDGQEIYFIAGNHVLVPESLFENSRVPTNWGEDNLFKPYLDARGHANDIKAPGGWIAKFKPDGSDWTLISAGYRNPFDMAFNQDGELFAYDADMEWDIGMPWYRPTRICHVTSGSEYGWRTGSGKWPAYYPDNLPAAHNLEQGSPTAVLSAANLKFPAKYKNGLLIMDWSFGTVYFIDLKAEGSSYSAKREEFLSGTPLPLTDMIAGTDGNLYFATGGRRIDSHLFRLRYTGNDSETAENSSDTDAEKLRVLRHNIEKYHSEVAPEAITLAWENLDHADRFIRYASRVALEHQPVVQWQERFFSEENPAKIIEAGIALAHQGDKSLQGRILEKLNPLNLESLSEYQQVALLRNYTLLFIRMGEPDVQHSKLTAQKLKTYFPYASNRLNRELGSLLLYLKDEGATTELVKLLEKHAQEKTISEGVEMLSEEATERSEQYGPLIRDVIAQMPPSESIYYGMLLSHAEKGWTKDAREKYFTWFFDVMNSKGGMSFKAYIENVRQKAMANVPKGQKEYLEELSGIYSPTDVLADLPKPIGPGKNYTMGEINDIYWETSKGYKSTIAKGERAYKAALCISCHRMKGEGGATGPDLTQAYSKFNSYNLTFAMVSPSDEISDQYANTIFHKKDGSQVIGRLLSEEGDSLGIMTNPYNPSYTLKLAKSNIEKQELSPISPMPPGLLNRLNEKEIIDLYAYLLSGGDKDHNIYTGK
ncbi:c-type cytochrome [Maribacter halichondriae]|uniref:c-type cytochrome n=1 Tax=Maribacter halichondriae TaxID=2980554 RepID=UPI00235854BB|nr:c-type cytochrome [Maribacter sp. Hal144]